MENDFVLNIQCDPIHLESAITNVEWIAQEQALRLQYRKVVILYVHYISFLPLPLLRFPPLNPLIAESSLTRRLETSQSWFKTEDQRLSTTKIHHSVILSTQRPAIIHL